MQLEVEISAVRPPVLPPMKILQKKSLLAKKKKEKKRRAEMGGEPHGRVRKEKERRTMVSSYHFAFLSDPFDLPDGYRPGGFGSWNGRRQEITADVVLFLDMLVVFARFGIRGGLLGCFALEVPAGGTGDGG